MHFHSLFTILASTAVHVVADPLPPWVIPPLDSTSPSNIRSKSVAKVPLLTPVEDKPGLVARAEDVPGPVPYWLEEIEHRGSSAFHPDPRSYKVFRNVKDFGAKGDGVTDDTVAINTAIGAGGRCEPGRCKSSTTSPALVYFPAGTYLISSSIVDYYYTQIIGNPNSLPVLKATPNFRGFGLINGDPYGENGLLYGATDVFYRQIRNLVFDLTAIPAGTTAHGIHWPTSQATSIQNCIFKMSDAPETQHHGLFVESGSGGVMSDLTFYGGLKGAFFGNQQFTVRNLTFYNAVTAIEQAWDWGWTYIGLSVVNCTTGLNMAAGGSLGHTVGSVTILDSSFTDTHVAILTARIPSSSPVTGGSLILDNILFTNVHDAIRGPSGAILDGGSKTVAGWGQGHQYNLNGPDVFSGPITPFARPHTLLTSNGRFITWSKPQYNDIPASSFFSIRNYGAKGDGIMDDTEAIIRALAYASFHKKVIFFDAGTYKVTRTIHISPNMRIVGESYPVIMGSGEYFSYLNTPRPVVMVGSPGDSGWVEWSDMIVSTQGGTKGAILIEWNLNSSKHRPSGMWDVHTRIGGFAGSDLQLSNCPSDPSGTGRVDIKCIAAFMSMHFTKTSAAVYMENNWFWVADHDMDDVDLGRITVYAGRGLYISSERGTFWLVGTSVEHHTMYQYQFANTRDVFAGHIQTETAYYQPYPPATMPFLPHPEYNDYNFISGCIGKGSKCAMGWGLRVVDSKSIVVYGAGLYSFFINYSTTCSAIGHGAVCQSRIFSVDNKSNIGVYNLNTIGATAMITRDDETDIVRFDQNANVFPGTIAYFKSN